MNNEQNVNSEPQALDVDDAADAILGRWDDGETLSEVEEEDATSEDLAETEVDEDELDDEEDDQDELDLEDPDEDETTDEDVEEDEDEDDEEDEEPLAASDDQIVDIAVNGESKKVSVKDLKRLYGQEASLTKKSQDLATQRKQSEEQLAQTQMSYQKLLERAEARYKPYADIDMLVASREMDAETFSQLRQDAKQAEDDLKFLQEESGQLVSQAQQQHQQATR
jgi:translation elongation factor P/translation initiation factor 5A